MDVELRTLQRSQVATVTTVTTVTRAEQDTMEVDENWGYPLDFGTPQMECGIHPMPSPCHKSPMLSMIAWCLETVGFPFLLILGMVYSRVYHITSIIHYLSVGLRCFFVQPLVPCQSVWCIYQVSCLWFAQAPAGNTSRLSALLVCTHIAFVCFSMILSPCMCMQPNQVVLPWKSWNPVWIRIAHHLETKKIHINSIENQLSIH